MTPRRSPAFRQVEFISLSDKRILLIIVTMEGEVENRVILTDKPYSASALTEAANYFNQNFAGHSFDQVRSKLRDELGQLRDDMTHLMSAAVDAGSAGRPARKTWWCPAAASCSTCRTSPATWATCAACSMPSSRRPACCNCSTSRATPHGVQIFIGGESELLPLDECSVVTAPYSVDGQVVGTLGVVGPTRMAYERVIPIVDITAKLLSSALSHH